MADQMKIVPSGTVIGYDAESGEKLFTEINRASNFPDEISTLPLPNRLYMVDDKKYRVVGPAISRLVTPE
jgi:hypothetical protein